MYIANNYNDADGVPFYPAYKFAVINKYDGSSKGQGLVIRSIVRICRFDTWFDVRISDSFYADIGEDLLPDQVANGIKAFLSVCAKVKYLTVITEEQKNIRRSHLQISEKERISNISRWNQE